MREPLATLGLSWPVTMDEVKTRYKELAKRHHPDANNGDRAAEERLKTINLAYATLRIAAFRSRVPPPDDSTPSGAYLVVSLRVYSAAKNHGMTGR